MSPIQPLACNFVNKESLPQVFSCEFCEIFKNIFFHRALSVAASVSTSEAESSPDVEFFIELFRQFPVVWNPKLNCFKDYAKKKNAWNEINTALDGSFSSKIILYFFIRELNISFLSMAFFFIESFHYK